MLIYRTPSRIEKVDPLPSWLPVSIEQVKLAARMDTISTMLDDEIVELIEVVTDRVESFTGIAVRKTAYRAFYDGFPVVMRIVRMPLINGTLEVSRYDEDTDSYQIIDPDKYQVRKQKNSFELMCRKSRWLMPGVNNDFLVDSVKVEFSAGYEEGGEGEEPNENVPPLIQRAIIASVVRYLTSPEPCGDGKLLTLESKRILTRYRSGARWL